MKQIFVRTESKDERRKLLDHLEKEGFYYWPEYNNRKMTEECRFPLVICLECKWVGCMGNVTCAAASVKQHISVKEFHERYRREQQVLCSPIMVHIPHSSTVVPDDEIDHFVDGELKDELLKMTDHYCDDLFDCEHDKLVFPVSRLVCDVERFRDDAREPMAACGMGFAYTHGSGLQKIRELTPGHKLGIETCYYSPHHNEFECMVKRRMREHGKCLIIDGHSFPGKALPYEMDERTERPDICVGADAYHTSRELSDMTKEFFEGKGYNVAVNDPFSGSIVPLSYYQKNPDVQSVMIEINRDLYMDAAARKTGGYAKVKRDVGEYLDSISKWFEGE